MLVRTNLAERPSLGAWPKCVSAYYRCELRLGRVANVPMWLGWQGSKSSLTLLARWGLVN